MKIKKRIKIFLCVMLASALLMPRIDVWLLN